MSNKTVQYSKWILLGLVFVVICLCRASQTTQNILVRVILLEDTAQGQRVGVLYQDPQAAANSAEAQAPVRLVYAEGESISAAFQALEKEFPGSISYQCSDYLLLCGSCENETVVEYTAQLQNTQQGRYAASVIFLSQDIEALSAIAETNGQALQNLLECVEDTVRPTVKLYECTADEVCVPFLAMNEVGEMQTAELLYECTGGESFIYDETQTQLYYLLSSTQGSCDFSLDGQAFQITARVHSNSHVLAGVNASLNDNHALYRQNAQEDNEQSQKELAAQENLCIYALVHTAQNTASDLLQMQAYLEQLANDAPNLLRKIGVECVTIKLYTLTQVW